jgi:hypothetical protein
VSFEEKLDLILTALLSAKEPYSNGGHKMSDLCQILKLKVDEGEPDYIESILLHDGYIQYINEKVKMLIRISDKGVNFVFTGGYVEQLKRDQKQEEKEALEIRLIKSSISNNTWTKWLTIFGLVVAIAALVVSIIALSKS